MSFSQGNSVQKTPQKNNVPHWLLLHGLKNTEIMSLCIITKWFCNALAARDLSVMSTSEDVDISREKLPTGEHFNNVLEGEKSQLQPHAPAAQQVNHSVQQFVSFLHPFFSILKPSSLVKSIGHGISGQSKWIWLIYRQWNELQQQRCRSVSGPSQSTRRASVKRPKRTRETFNSEYNTWKVCRIIAQHYTCRERSVLLLWFILMLSRRWGIT